MSDFTLNPLNVTINQVSLGNKKLTKSIFYQIEFGDCFTEEMDFSGDAVIGYVKEKDGRYLLWVVNGKLRKRGLTDYRALQIDIERASYDKALWFLNKTRLKYKVADDNRVKLSAWLEDTERYTVLVNKVKAFLETLNDKQIYL
jgi:hypothetical protein